MLYSLEQDKLYLYTNLISNYMTTWKIITILLLFALAGCHSNQKTDSPTKITQVTEERVTAPKQKESIKDDRLSYQELTEALTQDSIQSVRTLERALNMAYNRKGERAYTIASDSLQMRYGHLFSSSVKHLIIHRTFESGVNATIYKLHNNRFIQVCKKEMSPFSYLGDTLQDVNGDGKVDYLFHWYPASGCCQRDIYAVFIQKDNGDFTPEFEFINPRFSAHERIIRGKCYGYDAPLYKYKWNGYHIDTIEYIYFPESGSDHPFVRRKRENEHEKGEELKQLPKEYQGLGFVQN